MPLKMRKVQLEYLCELAAGELASLVGVEYVGPSLAEGLGQGLGTKAGLQSVGQSPGHHVPAVPVHDGHQVQESPGHGQVGDVGRPHLVRPGDRQIPQQVGIDPASAAGWLVRGCR